MLVSLIIIGVGKQWSDLSSNIHRDYKLAGLASVDLIALKSII